MNFKSIFSLSILLNIVKVLSALLINKLVAVNFGPAGMATYGQFQNLYGIFLSVSNASCQTGVLQSCSISAKSVEEDSAIVRNALYLSVFTSSFLIVFLLFSSSYIESLLMFNMGWYFYIIPALILFSGINLIFMAYANAKGYFKEFFIISLAIPVLTSLLALLLSMFLSMTGVLVSILIANFIVALGVLFRFKGLIEYSLNTPISGLKFEIVSKLMSFGLVSFMSGVTFSFAMLFSRNVISEVHGVAEAGYWDSIYRFSIYYNMLFMAPFAIYFFPKMASCTMREVKHNLVAVAKYYLPVMVGGVFFTYYFSDFLVLLIYSKQFLLISEYVYLMLIAESFKVFFAISCATILARNGKLVFVSLELIWAIIFTVLTNEWVGGGIEAVIDAYLWASAISCLLAGVILISSKWDVGSENVKYNGDNAEELTGKLKTVSGN